MSNNRRIANIAKPVIMSLDDNIIEGAPFMDWLKGEFETVMYIEKLPTKKYIAHCECGGVSILDKAKTGTYTKCPVCNCTVRLRHIRYRSYQQRRVVAVLENDNYGNIIERLFVCYKATTAYSGTLSPPSVLYVKSEEGRYFLECKSGLVAKYHKTFSTGAWRAGPCNYHGMGWGAWRADDMLTRTYPGNLATVLRGTPYQYSALEIACKESQVNPFYYLSQYKYSPQLEMFYKAGLVRLGEELAGWNSYESSLFIYEDLSPRIRELKTFKALGIRHAIEFEECRDLGYYQLMARKACKEWNIPKDIYPKAIEFMTALIKRAGIDFEYSFLKNEQFFKYWLTQSEKCKSARNFISDYTDYISDVHTLGLDVSDTKIKKPHDFYTMHAWTTKEIKAQETKIYDPQILAVYNSISKLCEWEDEKYSIILPRESSEIVEEGIRQSHCVARYCERVARGESVILFVRRKNALLDSWYTMEIKPDMSKLDIVQCRGFDNKDLTPEDAKEIERVTEKYTKWFNRRPLGGYQSEIMATYYKAVRKKNGKYLSNYDDKVEYVVGKEICAEMDTNPDKTAVKGLHIASLEFAQRFGDTWKDVAILEVTVNIHDVIVPDALDQVRASKVKVVREVPFAEMGEWGKRHDKKVA